MAFDRMQVLDIRKALEAALKALAVERGVKIRVGGGSYTTRDIRFTIEVLSPDADDPEVEQFRLYCRRYGLEPEDLGKEFTWKGRRFTLVACKPRSTRFPLIGRSADGRVYKFPVDAARLIRPPASK